MHDPEEGTGSRVQVGHDSRKNTRERSQDFPDPQPPEQPPDFSFIFWFAYPENCSARVIDYSVNACCACFG